jgi:hypothetical protein
MDQVEDPKDGKVKLHGVNSLIQDSNHHHNNNTIKAKIHNPISQINKIKINKEDQVDSFYDKYKN